MDSLAPLKITLRERLSGWKDRWDKQLQTGAITTLYGFFLYETLQILVLHADPGVTLNSVLASISCSLIAGQIDKWRIPGSTINLTELASNNELQKVGVY